MIRLTGKVALISGAARGIGAAIARAYCREGARVVATDIRDELGQCVAAVLGPHAEFQHLDVRSEADWQRVVESVVQRHGGLDILVNNAGITGLDGEPTPQDPEHAELDHWRAVHAINLDGVFLGCKHGIRAMRRGGAGSIINIGSRSGVVGIPGAVAYASSKAAVRNHTKSVALYCAEHKLRIRCNVIQPGPILTPMWEPILGEGPERDRKLAEFVQDVPVRRFGTVDEVAALAVHLAADESAYTTGAEFTIDGGLSAGAPAAPRPADPVE